MYGAPVQQAPAAQSLNFANQKNRIVQELEMKITTTSPGDKKNVMTSQTQDKNAMTPMTARRTEMVKVIGEKMGEGNGLVKLNIGGTWYTTTESTLTTFPEAIFPKMLAQRNNKRQAEDSKGYYFIDRDGVLFRHILNYMRTKSISLPRDFTDYEQLISEAEFYGLRTLANQLRVHRAKEGVKGKKVVIMEVVETAHPEKIGVCSSRIVVSEEMRYKSPFCDVVENMPSYYHEEYQGQFGRYWIRTNLTRLEWAEKLTELGWTYMGNTSIARRLPDITGKGTDLCHIVEKWSLASD